MKASYAEDYERELKERQRKHAESALNNTWSPCLHNQCLECAGTGRKTDGSMCIHMLSCPCSKCTPTC